MASYFNGETEVAPSKPKLIPAYPTPHTQAQVTPFEPSPINIFLPHISLPKAPCAPSAQQLYVKDLTQRK